MFKVDEDSFGRALSALDRTLTADEEARIDGDLATVEAEMAAAIAGAMRPLTLDEMRSIVEANLVAEIVCNDPRVVPSSIVFAWDGATVSYTATLRHERIEIVGTVEV